MRGDLTLGILASAFAGLALAHGGGLNAEGCHTNKSTGEYHCHRAPAAGAAAPAEKPAQQSPSAGSAQPAAGGSKCYVGPRGGTYTITPSGRKNYSGC